MNPQRRVVVIGLVHLTVVMVMLGLLLAGCGDRTVCVYKRTGKIVKNRPCELHLKGYEWRHIKSG